MSSLADQTRWMDATDQAALVASGEVSPSELLEAAIERIERHRPGAQRGRDPLVRPRPRDRRERRAARRSVPRRAVPASRTSAPRTRGSESATATSRSRSAHVVADADTTLVSRHRAAGLVIAGRTNSPELGSVPDHRAAGVGRDPQPVGHRPHSRRIERRCGGRGRVGHGAVRPRQRRRRIDPHPRIVLRARRAQAEPGPDHARAGPRRERAGVELCVSRTVRDTRGAARRDARPRRRRHRDRAGARPAVRRRARRRSGPAADRHPRPPPAGRRRRRASARTAARNVGALLESLGHHVEPAWPKALADSPFGVRFGALWSTNMGLSRRRVRGPARPRADGRRIRADEPGRRPTSPRTSSRSTTRWRWRRSPSTGARCSAGGTTAGICCSRRRSAELPLPLGTFVNDPDEPDGADGARRRVRAVHPAVQHQRPAGDQPARCTGPPRACRSACSSSPPTAARTS